jgi:hypothetical protein
MAYYYEEVATVGNIAAKSIEMLYHDESGPKIYSGESISGRRLLSSRLYPVLRKRAERRLAGDAEADLPPLPNAMNVQEERVAAILKEIDTTNNVVSLVASLSFDELLALEEPFNTKSNLWKKSVRAANVITRVKVDEKLNKYLPQISQQKGKLISEDLLTGMIDAARKSAAADEGGIFIVQRMPAFGGIVIRGYAVGTNTSYKIPWEYYLRNSDEKNRAYTKVSLSTPSVNIRAKWMAGSEEAVADKVETKSVSDDLIEEDDDDLDEDPAYSDEDKRKKMMEELKHFCDGEDNVFAAANITISAIPPKKDKKK